MKNQIKKIVLLILCLFLCITFVSCKEEDDDVTLGCHTPPVQMDISLDKNEFSKDEEYTFNLKYGHFYTYSDQELTEREAELDREICKFKIYNKTYVPDIYYMYPLKSFNDENTFYEIKGFYKPENLMYFEETHSPLGRINIRFLKEEKISISKELIIGDEGTLVIMGNVCEINELNEPVSFQGCSVYKYLNYEVKDDKVKLYIPDSFDDVITYSERLAKEQND